MEGVPVGQDCLRKRGDVNVFIIGRGGWVGNCG